MFSNLAEAGLRSQPRASRPVSRWRHRNSTIALAVYSHALKGQQERAAATMDLYW